MAHNQRRRAGRTPGEAPAPRWGRGRLRLTLEGIVLGMALLYALHQSHYILFEASYFKLQQVEILGLSRLTEEQVLRASGLELGMAAFRIDTELVADRVRRNPKVERCKVEQPSPQGLRMTLVERREVARVVLDDGVYEVGPEGEVMILAQADSVTPLLLDAEIEEGPPRRLVPRHRARLTTWLPVLGRGPTRDFTRMRFGGGGRLDVYWRDVRLVVDDPARFEKHRGFLGPVLADGRERGLGFDYIDLRFQDVVARYAPLAAAAPPVAAPAALGRAPGAPAVPDLEAFMERAAGLYEPPPLAAPGPGAGYSGSAASGFGMLPGSGRPDRERLAAPLRGYARR